MKINNNTLNHNITLLETRRRGQRFTVDKDGRLKIIKGLFEKIRYFFCRHKIQKSVKEAITTVVRDVENWDSYTPDEVQDLFFNKMKPLSKRIFDRSAITDKVIRILDPKSDEFQKDSYAWKVEQVRLAQKLGVKLAAAPEGSSGCYFGKDRFGKIQVVFKPADEGSETGNSPKLRKKIVNVLQKIFPCLRQHENLYKDEFHIAEENTWIADRHFDLNIVPETHIESFESPRFLGKEKVGSCQIFVDGAISAKKAYGIKGMFGIRWLQRLHIKCNQKRLMKLDSLDRGEFQKMVFLDFLCGGQDNHFKNWMIKNRKIVQIDNGAKFPFTYPKRGGSLRCMYLWGALPQADTSFDKTFIDKITLKIDEEPSLKQFDEKQNKMMKERIEILKNVFQKGRTMRYLSRIRTEKDFIRARKELGL